MDLSGTYSLDKDHTRVIRLWLFLVAALVFIMVVIGGITRLTNSGLSMVEWRPITGWLPPLSHEAWMAEFEKYRQFPEYLIINRGMSLDDFKAIYFWEYFHRLFGRLIGLAYGLPLAFFWLKGWIPQGYHRRLLLLFVLGGLQGALGWFMVVSGLRDRPDVSHYRLTMHLGMAIFIFGLLIWTALSLGRHPISPSEREKLAPARPLAWAVLILCFIQILLGGLVAGTNAGFTYNTWPLMDGRLVPDGLFLQSPWWLNFFENLTMIQFQHRIAAYSLLLLAGILSWSVWKSGVLAARQSLAMLWASLGLQVILGIAALLYVVPVSLGAAHQAGALLVLMAAIWMVYLARTPRHER